MSSTYYANGWCWFSHKLLMLAASKFNTTYKALDSFYTSTGNDVTSYFRSAANRINVCILGHVLIAISQWWFNRFWQCLQFSKLWFKGFISSYVSYKTFLLLDPQNGGSSGPAVVYTLRWGLIAIFSLYFDALHKWPVPYCCRGQLANARRCMVMHEHFRKEWYQVL